MDRKWKLGNREAGMANVRVVMPIRKTANHRSIRRLLHLSLLNFTLPLHAPAPRSYSGFRFLSTLLPITPPRIPPTAAPIKPPLTLFRLVAAPITAPAAAPMAASRFVFLTTVPPLEVVVVVVVRVDPEDVVRRRVLGLDTSPPELDVR